MLETSPLTKPTEFRVDPYSVEAFAAKFHGDMGEQLGKLRDPFYGVSNPVMRLVLDRQMTEIRATLAILHTTFNTMCSAIKEGRPITVSPHKDPRRCTVQMRYTDNTQSTYALRREHLEAFADFLFDPLQRGRLQDDQLEKQKAEFHKAFSSGQTIVFIR